MCVRAYTVLSPDLFLFVCLFRIPEENNFFNTCMKKVLFLRRKANGNRASREVSRYYFPSRYSVMTRT